MTQWEDKNQFVNDWVDTLIFWAQCSPCISSIGALNAYSAVMAGNQNNALMAGDGLVWSARETIRGMIEPRQKDLSHSVLLYFRCGMRFLICSTNGWLAS